MNVTQHAPARAYALTPKGQAVAVLHSLTAAWDSLTPTQQAQALGLLAELKQVYRPRPLPLVGRIAAL